jgi:hypothetical protein
VITPSVAKRWVARREMAKRGRTGALLLLYFAVVVLTGALVRWCAAR